MKSATTTTTTYTTSRKNSVPRLILNTSYPNVTTTTKSQAMTTTSITLTSSPVTTTGSFYLPPPPSTSQKQSKKSRIIQKHLRKPPAFDTYLRTTEPVNVNLKVDNYYNPSKRSSSLSSSCSSTSSEDNSRYPNFTSEEMMFAKKAVSNQPRSRRPSSITKFVRFADFNDGSSITDSSSGCNSADDWDPLESDEEEEEEFFFMTPRYPVP